MQTSETGFKINIIKINYTRCTKQLTRSLFKNQETQRVMLMLTPPRQLARKHCSLFICFVTPVIELKYSEITDFQMLDLEPFSTLKSKRVLKKVTQQRFDIYNIANVK